MDRTTAHIPGIDIERKGDLMKRKKKLRKKLIFGIALSVFLFIQLLFYNPFTPIGAVRWAVLWQGFVIESYTLKANVVPRSEISFGTMTAADVTKDQSVYYVTSHSLRDKFFRIELRHYVVTDKKNGLYHARFPGY